MKRKRQLSQIKVKCIDCKEKKQVVIVRGRGRRCEKCYDLHLKKRRLIRMLNNFASQELS